MKQYAHSLAQDRTGLHDSGRPFAAPGASPAAPQDPAPIAAIRRAAQAVRRRQEAHYDEFAARFRELYQGGGEQTREAVDRALASAREQLAAAGTFTAEQGERFERYLRRDLERAAARLARMHKGARERIQPARLGAGAIDSVSAVLRSAEDVLERLAERADNALAYSTGDITAAGTLTCTACRTRIRFRRTGTVPPCPKCAGTTFRKGY